MASNSADDFLVQFKAIGQSLKKRFFRKPNVAEAIQQFESLCQELKHDEQKEFAAICSLEQAKCYESIQNAVGQANSLKRGSKYLLEARSDYRKFEVEDTEAPYEKKIGGRADGQVQVSVQALEQCIKLYMSLENFGLVVLMHMKIGAILSSNNYFDQAMKHYEQALKVAENRYAIPDQFVIVEKIVKCKVKIYELESASQVVNDYLNKVEKAVPESRPSVLFNAFILKFQILRVCLLLILGCDSSDMVNFIWPGEETCEDEETRLDPESLTMCECLKEAEVKNSESHSAIVYLKSLVLAVQHGSIGEVRMVQTQLAPFLDETHHELFRMIIKLHA